MNITATVPQPGYNPLSTAPVNPDTGDLEMTVIKSVDQVRAAHAANWLADSPRRGERANVQAMVDGRQPFNPATMALNGLAACCNVNWRDGTLALQQAEAPYVDLLNSVPYFLNVKTKFGPQEDRVMWEQIMSEEYGFLLRSWESFADRFLMLVNYFLLHGVSMAYFNNATDWRWNIGTLTDFVVPELSPSDVNSIGYMTKRHAFTGDQLYDYIKKCPEDQRGGWYNGWHVPSVILAIKNAIPKQFYRANDWELAEQLWKGNEVYWYLSQCVTECILMWNRELDGTISQHIITESPMIEAKGGRKVSNEQFLYKETNFLPSLERGLIIFKYGIGTNGYIHSIRGLGNAIYPMVQAINAMTCRQVDAVNVELSIPIRATEDIMNNELALQFAGPFMYLMDGVDIVDRKAANYSNSVFPFVNQVNGKLSEQKGGYAGEADFGGNGEKTKFEMQARVMQYGALRVSQSNLFYNPLERLMKETLRRIKGMKSSLEPGGAEAFQWRQRCMERGVPVEAIDQIDIERCLVVRALGGGSPAARMASLDALEQYVPAMDAQGRNNYYRRRVAAQPGMHWSDADEFFPPIPNMRPDINVRFADLENKEMQSGAAMPVYPNDEHLVHARQHLVPMMEMVQAVDMGQMELTDSVEPLSLLYNHTFEHLQLAGNDPIMQREINQYRKDMQQVAEKVVNGSRKIQAEQQKAMESGEEYGGPEGLDPGQVYDVEMKKQQLYRQMKDDEFSSALQQVELQKAQLGLAEKRQSMVNNQRKVNSELTRQDVLTANKLASDAAKLKQAKRAPRKSA